MIKTIEIIGGKKIKLKKEQKKRENEVSDTHQVGLPGK